ncbi:MAG TPA: aminotransferase class I/II-fold pyridoxal phosphate-dependent enzyme [Thermomicrobiales bacterium]|nr:aminotransferase class I/II-fold pyridoxal phosphate-dependent enzyme [Thermomicrobiales bacterium]
MTKYEVNVRWDIAESGIFPMAVRDLLDLLPPQERESELDRLLDLRLGYSEACGSAELRGLIAATYENTSPDDILVTTGAIEANFLLFNELLSPGDRVVAVSPAYQQLHSVAKAIGCDVALWSLRDDGGFHFELDDLRALVTPETQMIVVNTPHNPTGAMLSGKQLRDIYALAEELDAWVLSDEAYRWLDLPGSPPLAPPMRDLGPRAISTGTFSKPFGLPGLRIGWIAAPEDVVRRCWGLRDYISLSPGKLNDALAVTAFRHRDQIVERTRRIVSENLPFAARWFAENADLVSWTPPRGGILAMMKYHLDLPSLELANRLAEDYSVMLAPGSAFGYEGYLRIGVGNDPEVFAEGLRQTASCLRDLADAGVGRRSLAAVTA